MSNGVKDTEIGFRMIMTILKVAKEEKAKTALALDLLLE